MSGSQLNSRDITFRTVFHDVEGIKSYLRRIRKENERVMTNIQSIVFEQVQRAFSSTVELNSMIISAVDDRIEQLINPLQTKWVDDKFINYIASSTDNNTINLISNTFMSIIEYNSENFNTYINSTLTTDRIEEFVSPLKTEWVNDGFVDYIADNISDTTVNLISNTFMSIVDYNSMNFNAYINRALTTESIEAIISPLKTEWISDYFISYITSNIGGVPGSVTTQDIQQTIANQFPEVDIKYALKDYHLIEKHYTDLVTEITIDTSGLINPATALNRFRILAYTKDNKSTSELNYTYTGSAIIEDAYVLTNSILSTTSITIANMSVNDDNDLSISFTSGDDVVNAYMGGTLWYGFTDLVEPDTNTNYTVMVSIDCSPNYLPLLTSAGGRFTVGYNERLGYISGAAEAIRNQFGSNIELVEVVPHPLLVNDAERYTVLRAITDSTNKGNWSYRNKDGSNADSYQYNKQYDRSVLKFSPLETPIMYANVMDLNGTTSNYYYYKLYQTFDERTDIYSLNLSNFVPWTTTLPALMTSVKGADPVFNNINDDTNNFGKIELQQFCKNDTNLASIDLRCIDSVSDIINKNEEFTNCNNLRTVYCNESVKELISSILPDITSHTWNYMTGISAWVLSNQ